MQLADDIRRFFFANFDKLELSRQFHFASRLAAWEGSVPAKQKLRQLKPRLVPADTAQVFAELLNSKLGPVFADNVRRPYFDQFPALHGINKSLFQIRHLKEIYGIDLRNDFIKIVPQAELENLARQLRNDTKSLRFLASFAVNFLYLLEKLFGHTSIEPDLFLNLQSSYRLDDPQERNLLVYLFTHCIIADSNFYIESLSPARLTVYRQMVRQLDELIVKNSDIKIDAKLEYLVASRICQSVSPLQAELGRQMTELLDPHGNYIIDREGLKYNPELNSLNVSEHRNVLFIMSTSLFRPHPARVD